MEDAVRLDWIEDIVAVLDAGSISGGAARRNVSQPAFSRRLRAAEEALGVALFDRGARPATARPGVAELGPRLRAAAREIRQLRVELRLAAGQEAAGLVLAAQHSLTTSMAAGLVERLDRLDLPGGVRLRSANRDECVRMLLAGLADIALLHRLPGEPVADRAAEAEIADFAADVLLPVATDGEAARLEAGELRLIAYPGEVFLGRVFAAVVAPALPEGLRLRVRAETALTPAALRLTLEGAGVAWLPRFIAREAVSAGRLRDLSDRLPTAELRVCAMRHRTRRSDAAERAWSLILA